MLFYCIWLVNPIAYHKKKWQEKALKRNLIITGEVKGFSPGFFNRLYVNRNKNLEQGKVRTKERGNNFSLFKRNSEIYGCQLKHLTGCISSSIPLDTSWTYGCQLWKLQSGMSTPTVDGRHSVFQVLGSSDSYVVNSDSWREALCLPGVR